MINPGTLRAEGISSVACDKPTRAKLKELAGDMPVSHYLRAIAFGSGSQQVPLPGQEREVSRNTIASVKADTEQTRDLMVALSEFLSGFSEPLKFFPDKDRQSASAKHIEARLRLLADNIKARSVADLNTQTELNLG